MAEPPKDEPFLSRWSKRKREVEAEPAPAPEPEPETAPPDAEEIESLSAEELAALPRLEDFTPATDIRPFLRKGVPQALRNSALRRIWMITPAIRDHADPAVDYAWDWNTPGGVPGDGLAPSKERMAEMLRELVAPRRNAETEKVPEEPQEMAREAPDQDTDSAPQHLQPANPEASEAAASVVSESAAPTEEKTKANQSTNPSALAQRRHGGALPH